jgi:altronate hydrolase
MPDNMPNASLTIRLAPNDNVAVSRAEILAGTALAGEDVTARTRIPTGHKVATRAIAEGQPVMKYDQVIGFASHAIEAGDHVHVHNCAMADFDRDYAFSSKTKPTEMVPEAERATFQGFRRPDGRAGTRNYIGILTTVNCSATVARYIAEAFNRTTAPDYPNVDGVVAFVHGPAAAWPGRATATTRCSARDVGLCPSSQLRRGGDGRAWLRGEPDPFLIDVYGLEPSLTASSF